MAKQAENETTDFFGGFEAVFGNLSRQGPSSSSGIPGDSGSPVDMSRRSVSSGEEKEYDIVDPEDALGEEVETENENE